MDKEEKLPLDVMLDRVPQSLRSLIDEVLQVVKASTKPINQFEQHTSKVPDGDANGIKKSRIKPLSEHVVDAFRYDKDGLALYMHNLALIEVLGPELTHRLYAAVRPLDQDVLVRYPLLYVSEYPKSSSDVLVGSPHSWSPLHQDLPLYCSSAILVLEGHKEFIAVPHEVAPFLPMNGPWERPHTYAGVTYPDLQSLVLANGGTVLSLRAGDLMVMPARTFHLARNVEATISCNFSIVVQEDVPLMVLQTLDHISSSPQDVMHFDSDFARLLEDCTAWVGRCWGNTDNQLAVAHVYH